MANRLPALLLDAKDDPRIPPADHFQKSRIEAATKGQVHPQDRSIGLDDGDRIRDRVKRRFPLLLALLDHCLEAQVLGLQLLAFADLMNDRKEAIEIERLDQVSDGRWPDGQGGVIVRGVAGYDQNIDLGQDVFDSRNQLQPRNIRQVDVEQQNIERLLSAGGQRLAAGAGHGHRVSFEL